MSEHRYVTYDVFTDRAFGGNQLAVFPDATGIPDELLLTIAREFNFSETSFCYPPENPEHAARVRIFTPGSELQFAGHPTVGTAITLCTLGLAGASKGESEIVLEEGVGPVPVKLRFTDGEAPFAQFSVAKLPEFGPTAPSRGKLAEMLLIDAEDILGAPMSPQGVSCGLPFLIVPVRSLDALARARVRMETWEQTLKASWASELFLFTPDAEGGPNHYRARCFAPGQNISEDPATGSANACFAGYLASKNMIASGTLSWTVDQGVEMGRPSRLEIEADKQDGAITAVRVGGQAVHMSTGTLRLP
jgi:trans-2,3-dihydro-3-hydroxyanthranilate isomerase